MDFKELDIPGCILITPPVFRDARGMFVKTFLFEDFQSRGLCTTYAEEFHSNSVLGVIRGLHFQCPPYDHIKVVSCLSGHVLDVVVDIRRSSPTYGRSITIDLYADSSQAIYIPRGCAHGFLALSDEAIMTYKTSSVHSPEYDSGLRWDSIAMTWPIANPILSERDANWPALSEFNSPFK